MSCSCNASALRLFARGLVQVHHSESGRTFALPIRVSSSPRLTEVFASQRRPLHASRALEDAENSATASADPENHPKSTEDCQPSSSSTPTEPTSRMPATRATSHEEEMTEARAKAAWRFKRQGFDWKSFRSNDPAVRAKVDFSNFDWNHWQGKKQGTRQLGKLVDNLEAARAEDLAAVGISPRGADASRTRDYRGRQIAPSTSTSRYEAEAADDDDATPPPKKEEWMMQKAAMKAKFPEGWRPHKRLSPDALAGIRALNAQFPDVYTTQTLADKFAVSPEAIRRILKSKWTPSAREEEDRQQRWHRRGVNVWERKAELGIKPPKRWRDEGIAREPAYHDRKAAARRGREEHVRREREAYMRSFTKGGREARRGGDSDGTGTVERTDARLDGETPVETPRRGTSRGESGGSVNNRETRSEPEGDVFDKTLGSKRRD